MNSALLSETVGYTQQVCTEPSVSSIFKIRMQPLFSRGLSIRLTLYVIVVLIIMRVLFQFRFAFPYYNSESNTNELIILPESFTSYREAYCLDGSPPGYYYRPSSDPSVRSWIIYLPSGAWCISEEDCYNRSLTYRGSSHHAAASSMSFDGFLSSNCDTNPDFCFWNVIVLHYCDGGSFLGNMSGVLNYNSKTLYLRGALIFNTLIEYLLTETQLGHAEQIVLAGSSAGGVGALIHADYLRSRLPKSVKTFHVLVDGSMFADTPNINGQHIAAETFQAVYKFHHMKYSLSAQECRHKQSPETEWKCLLPEVYHYFVFTPIFFINSLYDTWQRINFLEIPCCTVACPNDHTNTVNKLRDSIQTMASQILTFKKNGVFLTSCPLHTILVTSFFSDFDLGSQTLQRSVGSWLLHDVKQTNFDAVLNLTSALEQCPKVVNHLLNRRILYNGRIIECVKL